MKDTKKAAPGVGSTEGGKAETACGAFVSFFILPQARPAVKGWLNGRA